MFALIKNGVVTKYPYYVAEMRKDNPSVSIPQDPSDSDLALLDIMRVFNTTPPAVASTEVLEQGTPVFSTAESRWVQVWVVRQKTAGELAAEALALQELIVGATQQRLDDFAKTRNYDGILSACTYASSSVPSFAAEGQRAVDLRDQTWAALYTVMGEVQAQTRPMPASFEDVEPLLPALTWTS